MPKVAAYTTLRKEPLTLAANGNHSFTFNAPDVNGTSNSELLFVLAPEVNAHLTMTLNAVVIYTNVKFGMTTWRSLNVTVDDGIVLPAGNTLTVTNNGTDSLDMSDVIMFYEVNV